MSSQSTSETVAIIGGGPAGLRAAELISAAGISCVLYDSMPSVGRKFLVAGKSGLNLTKDEDLDTFISYYGGSHNGQFDLQRWASIIKEFDNKMIREWAEGLGITTFTANSGKVFPEAMKAAPLLRRWVHKLREQGVNFRMRHKLASIAPAEKEQGYKLTFTSPLDERTSYNHRYVVLAMGGASWPQTGSDGAWRDILDQQQVCYQTLQADNCGWMHPWNDEFLKIAEGKPLKNIHLSCGDQKVTGEVMITKYGLEGSAIYQIGRTLRSLPKAYIEIDLKPTFTHDQLVAKMGGKQHGLLREAKYRWKLSPQAMALIKHQYKHTNDVNLLATQIKACRIDLDSPRPIDEVISTSGGICWSELNEQLMLNKLPGIFACGEMIDWEAPTGGYLMQGCFASGTRVGKSIIQMSAEE
ncbi:NAD(P)/FAD-dependent oxidoreductase [Persicirhabdus sediminis]|uniref:TIGR03862 family flavoprotein n=1 Tax=Persicirhabdus sediminis TaxID=454144 RepID=A0A8J7SJC9_9BACT|nr:TIGR03862 family flavoprotein [Persicirhabdus sediminis]MBK1790090.1 TIGR03862 family flavoprotein [Persicirhabdus sediminis]